MKKPIVKKTVTERAYGKIDWVLIAIVVILVCYGLLMLYSASSYNANIEVGQSYYYVKRQAIFVLIGMGVMFGVTFIPYKFWEKVAIPLFVISIILVVLVVSPLGYESHGARRWLDFKFTTVQPSEIMKVAIILVTAALLAKLKTEIEDVKTYLIILAASIIGAALTALITDDLGTAIIIMAVGLIMIFVTHPNIKYLLLTILGIVVLGVSYVFLRSSKMQRIEAWLHIDKYSDGIGYQITQGLYAIGSGGIMGKGLGQGTQKLGFVPESENDMIFSIICEELGLLGAIVLIALIILLLWRMKKIFDNTSDMYGRAIIVGVASHIAIQSFINLAVVTNLIPNTGVPLPFISYGGSAILFLLIEIGIVLSVGRNQEVIKVNEKKRKQYYQQEKEKNPISFL